MYIHFLSIILLIISQKCDAFQTPLQGNWINRNDVIIKPSQFSTTSSLQASKRSGAISRNKKKKGSDSNSSNSSGGFGQSNENETPPVKQIPAGAIYSRPALYDLAFGYRNYEEEVNFLLDAHDKFSINDNLGDGNGNGRNILELAAGPARHSITSLRNNPDSVASCTAVDLSTDMMEYSNEVADEELGDAGFGGVRDRFYYINTDMRYVGNDTTEEGNADTLQPCSYDSAWILLGSMQHLTTNADVISCFKSVHNLLRPGGTMVVELPHPRETFTMVECTRNGWEVPLEDEEGNEYGELKIIWGDDDDKFDPIRQVRDFTVAMELTTDDKSDLQSVREVVPMRLFTFQEIDALSNLSGFKVTDLYGALSDEIDVNNEDEAFRLVCVLRKEL